MLERPEVPTEGWTPHDFVHKIEEAIDDGATRDQVADLYRQALGAMSGMRQEDWTAINLTIIDHWSLSALTYIKRKAWA
jgi:hypothetical protein